jgi:hypothetical protein
MSTRDSVLQENISVSLSLPLSHFDIHQHTFRTETGFSDRKQQSAFSQGVK